MDVMGLTRSFFVTSIHHLHEAVSARGAGMHAYSFEPAEIAKIYPCKLVPVGGFSGMINPKVVISSRLSGEGV